MSIINNKQSFDFISWTIYRGHPFFIIPISCAFVGSPEMVEEYLTFPTTFFNSCNWYCLQTLSFITRTHAHMNLDPNGHAHAHARTHMSGYEHAHTHTACTVWLLSLLGFVHLMSSSSWTVLLSPISLPSTYASWLASVISLLILPTTRDPISAQV